MITALVGSISNPIMPTAIIVYRYSSDVANEWVIIPITELPMKADYLPYCISSLLYPEGAIDGLIIFHTITMSKGDYPADSKNISPLMEKKQLELRTTIASDSTICCPFISDSYNILPLANS